jgi:hypothetical protein
MAPREIEQVHVIIDNLTMRPIPNNSNTPYQKHS